MEHLQAAKNWVALKNPVRTGQTWKEKQLKPTGKMLVSLKMNIPKAINGAEALSSEYHKYCDVELRCA